MGKKNVYTNLEMLNVIMRWKMWKTNGMEKCRRTVRRKKTRFSSKKNQGSMGLSKFVRKGGGPRLLRGLRGLRLSRGGRLVLLLLLFDEHRRLFLSRGLGGSIRKLLPYFLLKFSSKTGIKPNQWPYSISFHIRRRRTFLAFFAGDGSGSSSSSSSTFRAESSKSPASMIPLMLMGRCAFDGIYKWFT